MQLHLKIWIKGAYLTACWPSVRHAAWCMQTHLTVYIFGHALPSSSPRRASNVPAFYFFISATNPLFGARTPHWTPSANLSDTATVQAQVLTIHFRRDLCVYLHYHNLLKSRVYDQMKAFAVPNRPRQNPSLTESDLDERAAAVKSWSRYRVKQERENSKRMLELTAARDNALAELKMVDMNLYTEAITVDETLFPITFPVVTDTPPKDGYSTGAAV